MLPSQLIQLDFAASTFVVTNSAPGPMPFPYGHLEGANPPDTPIAADTPPWFAGFAYGNLNRGR